MGASDSRPSSTALTPVALNDQLDGDLQYLSIDLNALNQDDYATQLYIHAVEQAHIERNDAWLTNKQYKLHHKLNTAQLVNSTQYTPYFITKYKKHVQRLISEYAQTHDVDSDMLTARLDLALRSHRSYINMCARQELNGGKRSENTNEEKRAYVKALLTGTEKNWIDTQLYAGKPSQSTDTAAASTSDQPAPTSADSLAPAESTTAHTLAVFRVDEATVNKLTEHADDLPDILGATGLLGILSSAERAAYVDAMKRRAEMQRQHQHRGATDAQALLHRLGMQVQHVAADDDVDDHDDNDEEYDESDEQHDDIRTIRIDGSNRTDLQAFLNVAREAGINPTVINASNIPPVSTTTSSTSTGQRQDSADSPAGHVDHDVLRSLQNALRDVNGMDLVGAGGEGGQRNETRDIQSLMQSLSDIAGVDISGGSNDNDNSTDMADDSNPDSHDRSSNDDETDTQASTQVQRSESAAASSTTQTTDESNPRATSVSATEEYDSNDDDDETDEELQAALRMSLEVNVQNEHPPVHSESLSAASATATTLSSNEAAITSSSESASASPAQPADESSGSAIVASASPPPADNDSDSDYTTELVPPHLRISQEDYEIERAIRASLRPQLLTAPNNNTETAQPTIRSIDRHANRFEALVNSSHNTPRNSTAEASSGPSLIAAANTSSSPHAVMLTDLLSFCDNITRTITSVRQSLHLDDLPASTDEAATSSDVPRSASATITHSESATPTSATSLAETNALMRLRNLLRTAETSVDQRRARVVELQTTDELGRDEFRNFFIQSTGSLQELQDSLQQLSTTSRPIVERQRRFAETIERRNNATIQQTETPTTPATRETTSAATSATPAPAISTVPSTATAASTTRETSTRPANSHQQPTTAASVQPHQFALNANDREFRSKALLTTLLTECIRVNDTMFDTLVSGELDAAAIRVNPSFRLLYLVQRDLFRKSGLHRKDAESLSALVNHHCIKLLIACIKTVEQIAKAGTAIDAQRVKLLLHSSLIGQILPPSLTFMYAVVYQPHCRTMASQMSNLLLRFTDAFTDCLANIDQSVLSQQHQRSKDIECEWVKTVVAESGHCYQPSTQDDQQIEIPNSTHIIVHFDARCATTRNRDFLELYSADGTPVRELHGEPSHWPKRPIVVQGDRITFRFRSDAVVNNEPTKYGYKAYVTGLQLCAKTSSSNTDEHKSYQNKQHADNKLFQSSIAPPDMSHDRIMSSAWLTSTHQLATKLLVRCSRVMCSISHKEAEADRKHAKWLTSQLFMNGSELYQCDTRAVIIDTRPELIVGEPQKAVQIVTSEPSANVQPDATSSATAEAVSLQAQPQAQPQKSVQPSVDYKAVGHLTIGADENAEFLVSYIQLQNNSQGMAFDKRMKQLVKSNALQSRGGEVVHQSVRCVVAALLKHMELVSAARQLAEGQLHDDAQQAALCALIRKGQSVHRWIISTRQAVQQELATSDAQLSEEMQELQGSLEVFCAPVTNRALFLCSLKPAAMAGEHDGMQLVRTYSNSRMRAGHIVNGDTHNSTLLKLWNQSKRNSMKASEHVAVNDIISNSVVEQALLFVQDVKTPLQQFQQLFGIHTTRAKQRIEAINTIIKMTTKHTDDFSHLAVILTQWIPFRHYGPYKRNAVDSDAPAGLHHMHGVELCSPSDKKHLDTAFNELLAIMCRKLQQTDNPSHQAILLNCVAVEVDKADHMTVDNSGLITTLGNIITKSDNSSLSKLAANVKLMLELDVLIEDVATVASNEVESTADSDDVDAMQLTRVLSRIAPSPTSLQQSPLTSVQQYMLSTVMSRLNSQLLSLPQLRQKLIQLELSDAQIDHASASQDLCKQYCADMSYCITQLSTLYNVCRTSSDVFGYMFEPDLCQQVSAVIAASTVCNVPRLQHIAHQFVVLMLRRQADSSMLNQSIQQLSAASDLVEFLYTSVGCTLASQLADDKAFDISPYNYLTGEVMSSNAARCLAMLHSLSSHRSYATLIQTHVQRALANLPADTRHTDYKQYGNAMTALCLLGGFNDRLRLGCTVVSTSNSGVTASAQDQGIVVSVDRLSNKVKVLFKHSPNRLVECDCTQVKPITSTVHSAVFVELDGATLKAMEQFVHDLIDSNDRHWRKYEEAKVISEARQKDEAERAAADKQQVAAQQAEAAAAQADATWSCSVCTFTNPASDRQCNMCTSPAPPITVVRAVKRTKTDVPTADTAANDTPMTKDEPDVPASTLLYHQMRSVALKALSSVLLRHGSSNTLHQSKLLPLLLKLSTLPTEVEGFHSIDQLDAVDERLCELLHNYKHGVGDEQSQLKRSMLSYELIHTPLRHLTVHVPSVLDVSSSRGVTFSTDNINMVSFDKKSCGEAVAGAAHSNYLVPATIPCYYFEVTVINAGEARSGKAFNIAVGLHRSGFELTSRPGTHSGYAYTATGDVMYTEASSVTSAKHGGGFVQNDTVGVLWNIKQNTIAFTLNGQRVMSNTDKEIKTLSNVNGRFYPAVWLEANHAAVRVNFGQKPFMYAYESELPTGYEQELISEQSVHASRPQRTAAEMRRRTMAEELVIMMGGTFPIELCEIAIERCNDDVTYAANWLIESGMQELERMSAEAIRASQAEEEERKLAEIGVTSEQTDSDDNDDDLMEWLTGAASQTQQPPHRSAQGWIIGRAVPQRRPVSNAAELLDDDIENAVPLGVERQEVNTQPTAEPARVAVTRASDSNGDAVSNDVVRLDEVTPGQLLAVSSNVNTLHNASIPVTDDEFTIDAYAGRVGIVSAINVNNRTIQLLFVSTDKAMKHQLWFPITRLIKPTRLWMDAYTDVRGTNWNTLANAYIENEQMLSLRRLRSSILKLFQDWPVNVPFTLEQLGGSTAVMNILKLASSEYLYTAVANRQRVASASASHPVIDALRDQLISIVKAECQLMARANDILPQLRLTPSHYNNRHGQHDLTQLLSGKQQQPLSVLMVEECILHFVQAVRYPPPVIVKQSAHPYKSHSDVRDKLQIPGASKLLITFDAQCSLSSDMLTRLAFYRDDQYQDTLVSCGNRQRMNRFEPFVVIGDTVYYKFTSGSNADQWGYKFKVTPVELRISDYRALRSLNMEMTAYLLQFILNNVSTKLFLAYMVDLYNAIVFYVIHAKPSSKSRGVELLTKFLLHAHQVITANENSDKYQHGEIDLSQLQPLSTQMEQLLDTQEQAQSMQSAALQSLVELMATASLHSQTKQVRSKSESTVKSMDSDMSLDAQTSAVEQAASTAISVPTSASAYIDVSAVSTTSIRVVRAVYGILDAPELQRDVTSDLQSYLISTGSTQLYIPASNQLLQRIQAFSTDPAPKRTDKKLALTYEVVKHSFDMATRSLREIVLRRVEKTCNLSTATVRTSGFMIRSDMSVLDKIVQLSGWSMELSNSLAQGHTVMPHELAMSAARHEAIARSYYPVIPITGHKFMPQTRHGQRDAGYAGNNFTLSFWLYMTDSVHADVADSTAVGSEGAASDVSGGDQSTPAGTPAIAKKTKSAVKPLSKQNPMRHIVSKGNNNVELSNSHNSHSRALMYYHSGWSIHLGHSDDRVSFTVYVPYQPSIVCTSNTELLNNKWTHVSVLVTRGQVKLVLNGVEDAHKRIPPFRRFTRDPFLVGKLPVGYHEVNDSDGMRVKSAVEMDDCSLSVSGRICDMRFYTHTLSVSHLNKHVKSVQKSSGFKIESIDSHWDVKDRHKVASVPAQHVTDIQLDSTQYTSAMDRQLINMFTTWIEQDHAKRHAGHQHNDRGPPELPSMNDVQIHSPLISIDEQLLVSYPLISHLSMNTLKSRFVCIQFLNLRIASVLPCIDFSQAGAEWSLAHRLSQVSSLILREVKNIAWHRILQQTCSQQSMNVVVNRSRAQRSKEKGELDGLKSVFGQLYRQLHFIKPSTLRCQYNERPFRLTYEGEGGTDAGGLFRDSLSHMCAELQSPHVPLFIPTPNSRSNTQDMYICAPTATTPLHISMYAFVGKLMGIAIRGGHVLNLDLPSCVWKSLVQQPITIHDIAEIDSSVMQPLTDIQTALAHTDQPFSELVNSSFTAVSLDSTIVELKAGGADIPVTAENHAEFTELYTQYKTHEVDAQIDAIRRGISTIVPVTLLPLFTYDEVEQMICGKREIDVDYLRSNTRYRSPISSSDQHIQWLWRALSEFTLDERQKFLRFTWGQSRLPAAQHEWTQKMEITPAAIDTDGALPVSHTCFFSIEMPKYSAYEILREKIRYAINHAISIDTDYNARADEIE